MNFLAHLYLSGEDEDLLIGNFIADFIRNREVPNYSEGVQKGIHLHRKIDYYTDNHLVVRKGTHRLRANHGKYAPVVLDVLFDYLLANNWEKYSDEPITDYTKKVYAILTKNRDILPAKIGARLPEMIADNWLIKYGWDDGLRYVFERMKTRVSQPLLLNNSVESLKADYDLFEAEFNEFFPEVIAYVNKLRVT
ncbi:MAG: acyl carrier protein phosphodiesterase [Paraglaciecola sp.]